MADIAEVCQKSKDGEKRGQWEEGKKKVNLGSVLIIYRAFCHMRFIINNAAIAILQNIL